MCSGRKLEAIGESSRINQAIWRGTDLALSHSLSLPTLLATEHTKRPTGSMSRMVLRTSMASEGKTTDGMLSRSLLPTIGASEYKGSGKKRYNGSRDFHGSKTSEALRNSSTNPQYLNPSFGEVVMGFPEGWAVISKRSALRLLGTRSSRKSHSSSQEESKS